MWYDVRSILKLVLIMTYFQMASRAKADVLAFAQNIVHWVGEMRLSFQSGEGGHFTSRTKKNLKKIRYASSALATGYKPKVTFFLRELIDEICKWATARLMRLTFRPRFNISWSSE